MIEGRQVIGGGGGGDVWSPHSDNLPLLADFPLVCTAGKEQVLRAACTITLLSPEKLMITNQAVINRGKARHLALLPL